MISLTENLKFGNCSWEDGGSIVGRFCVSVIWFTPWNWPGKSPEKKWPFADPNKGKVHLLYNLENVTIVSFFRGYTYTHLLFVLEGKKDVILKPFQCVFWGESLESTVSTATTPCLKFIHHSILGARCGGVRRAFGRRQTTYQNTGLKQLQGMCIVYIRCCWYYICTFLIFASII